MQTTFLLLFTIFLTSRADVSHLSLKYLTPNKAHDTIEETQNIVEEKSEPKIVNTAYQAQDPSPFPGPFVPTAGNYGGLNGIPGFPQQQAGFPGGFLPGTGNFGGLNGAPNGFNGFNGFPQQQAAQQQGFPGAFLPGFNGLPNGIPGLPQQQNFPGFQQGFGQGFGQQNTGFPLLNFGNPLQQFGNPGFPEANNFPPFQTPAFTGPNQQLPQFIPRPTGGFQQPGSFGLSNNLRTLADSTVYDSNGGYVYEKPLKSFE